MATQQTKPDDLPDDVEELKRRCIELEKARAALEMDRDILAQTVELLKKDPSVDGQELANSEKARLIGALSQKYPVAGLCGKLSVSRGSYYYAKDALGRPDPHLELRGRIRAIFEKSRATFGSERIWHVLRVGDDGLEPLRVSEKVIRRLMKEEGLKVIYRRRRRHLCAYVGEVSAHPGNLVNRRFYAEQPNRLWLTDITQFNLATYKCYLSVIIDCFDGRVVAHRLSLHPDATLANATLKDAVSSLGSEEHPIIHSDCGGHCRWPGWIELCSRYGLTRSTSKKSCSPDNAACEGFFGRLKNEFFYYRDWKGMGFSEFSRRLCGYIDYYNQERKKKSLGWRSPDEYRKALGYTV